MGSVPPTMDIPSLIQDVTTLCNNEAADGTSSHLRNVRGMLESLASYVSKREQAIEARVEGINDAMGLEGRAELQILDLTNDGNAMMRSWDITAPCSRCEPHEADSRTRALAEALDTLDVSGAYGDKREDLESMLNRDVTEAELDAWIIDGTLPAAEVGS